MAITWLPGVATNITPSCTMGAASCPLIAPVENDHTGFSRATLAGVICVRGLWPHPSYVRRFIIQSPSFGLRNRDSVTGV